MPDNDDKFKFEFSLEVLNHLGRGLYRSFATVVAEAISNAWDAEAGVVEVTISKNKLVIEDDGKGMDSDDFQNRFLNVGYSRRDDKQNKSKRKVIGRKGIGKLAMLSISDKVTIVSKKSASEVTGGIINNAKLDDEIKNRGNYFLEKLTDEQKKQLFPLTKKSGTKIIFDKVNIRLNSEDVIKKYLATQFNFIFSLKKGDSFVIKVNNQSVTLKDLEDLNINTQFIWYVGKKDKRFSDRYQNLKREKIIEDADFEFEGKKIQIKGFVASVEHAKQILLKGSKGDFKASVNLFTNGRLRQEDIFEEVTRQTVTEEYLYGEIHVDGFEDEKIDRFTSSREGIIKSDPLYQEFLKRLDKILFVVVQDWTPWRRELRQDVDIDQDSRPGYEVRMEESRNRREKDFQKKLNATIDDTDTKKKLRDKLKTLSYKNILVYQDLYILENIFREYIKLKDIKESDLDDSIPEEAEIKKVIKDIRDLRKSDEERHALKGKIVKNDHYLNHLYLFHLGEIIDCKINKVGEKPKTHRKPLEADTKEINPVRNAVMHTIEVTDDVVNWGKIKNVIDYIERLNEKVDRQRKKKKDNK